MNNFSRTLNLLSEARGKVVHAPPISHGLTGFKTAEAFFKWYNSLGLDDIAADDVVLEDTGEVMMEKGESRRKKLKKKGRKDYNEFGDRSFETIKQKAKDLIEAPILSSTWYDFENDFYAFYDVKLEDISKVAGVDPDEYAKLDYDTYGSMPHIVKRLDGRKFVDNDAHNIKEFMKYTQNHIPHNIKLVVHDAVRGKSAATFDLYFN